MMRRMATGIALLAATTCALACSAETGSGDNPYSTQADEVELLAAALEEEMAADETDEAVSDGTMEGMRDAARRGRHQRGRGGHMNGRAGRGHLLRWFGDPEALQVCRDAHDACTPGDEACRDQVKACVRSVLEDAFAALCEEATTMCSEDDAPARPCGRIEAACSGDFDALRDGLPRRDHHGDGGGDGGIFEGKRRQGDWGGRDRNHDGPPPAEADAGLDV